MSNVFDYPEPKEEYTFSDAVSDAIEGFMTTMKSLCRVWFSIQKSSIETMSVNVLK